MTFENPTIKEILEKYRRIWAIHHASSVLGWDMEVYMPKQGIMERSVAEGELSVMSQELLLEPDFVALVDKAAGFDNLSEEEKGVVRVLKRDIKISSSFPPEFVREVSETTSKATSAWKEAKDKDDYSKFAPWLDKLMDIGRRAADYLGYEKYPYDALLDMFEEGLTTDDVESIFSKLENELKPILDKILAGDKVPKEHPLEKLKYDTKAMSLVNEEIVRMFGFPIGERSRIDVSAHPFTTEFGVNDVRITTRYEGFDFKRSVLSTVHEFGHALYELQQNPDFMFTPIIGGVSLGIHESQSRFWENVIGRSMEFAELMHPILKKHVPEIGEYSPEEIYWYFNTVRPDLIRTEADVVTYNFHILVRFKIEKIMINEGIKAKDLPDLWNEEMEKLLGIKPKSYADGILQDIHWAHGTIGYFPTYTIGTLLSAQLASHMEKDIGKIGEHVRNKDFEPIKEWLRNKIHKYGSIYPPKELVRRSTGENLEPEYFIKYVREKYL